MRKQSLAVTTLSLLSISIFSTFPPSHGSNTTGIRGSSLLPSTTDVTARGTRVSFSPAMAVAGLLCFLAASVSSAGGVGGGGLFVPVLKVVGGLDLRTASSFSAFMVTGGSVANVVCSLFVRSPRLGNRCPIDYDIALLSEPCMLLGVSVGVICNLVFPEWLITALFAVFLGWSTFATCRSGIWLWKLESEQGIIIASLGKEDEDRNGIEDGKEPLLQGTQHQHQPRGGREGEKFPWTRVGVLIAVWFSFFVVYLLRGNRYGQGIIPMEQCGPGYWMLTSFQIPLAVAFTWWTIRGKDSLRDHTQHDPSGNGPTNRLIFPLMALAAGLLGGLFGIGGGMLISPLLLQVGIPPEITSATCSFMVFFSTTMSALQYVLLGMDGIKVALVFSVMCFVSSNIGIMVLQRAIEKSGRASLIVFSVGTVMAVSTILMTGYGSIDVWKDYVSGRYMGFKSPC
ncbi:hypothetical protein MLD38_039826 [Melastoma candidum]|uniref:Uncharacterized protein n=1 Tax=Melastoma candidum TaxID=119954 RepID=A0ACB9L3C7_9MYRT|nr:hypothetical protein MLD38_039826 [Melastoma candidum]